MSAPKASSVAASAATAVPAAPAASGAPAAPAAPAAAPKAIIRRRRPANPLVQKKKPPPRPPFKPTPPGQNPSANGAKPLAGAKPSTAPPQNPPDNDDDYEEFEIKTTRRALADSLRWHVMRFMTNASSEVQDVNLLNEHQFQRPIRLHRRDPRANNMNQIAEEGEGSSAADKQVDDKERERLEAIRAEKRAEREALAAQTAPVARKDPPVKKNRFGKKLDQSRTFSDAQDKKKNATIKYEEALPWHIEDFEDNNVWRGTYETALSENHVVLVPEGSGFRMVVIDKWYKFTPKNRFKALSFEEAENAMKKGAKDPLAVRNAQRHAAEQRQEDMVREQNKGLFKRKGARGEKNPRRIKKEGDDDEDDEPEAAVDIDDIDFNYDEDFADDEEGPELVGAEEQEQAKETGDRLKREMREAPVFELREDKDHDAEEEEQKRKAAQERKHRKRVEKALKRREKNFQYDDDSDDNPYASDGDSEDSEIERQKAEEAKLEEEKKAADSKSGAAKPGDKAPAAPIASKSGSHHPLKPNKSIDPLRKLKRPGSPSMSEASGNESSGSRKKPRKTGPGLSALGEGSTISRPGSPASGMAAPQAQRPFKPSKMAEGGAGSGSEVELSDGTRVKRGSKKRGPPTTSPDGSRPGSPGASGPKKKQKFDGPLPDFIDQVLAAIPPEGVGIRSFIDRKDIKPWVAHPGFMPKLKSKMYSNAGMLTPKSSQQSGDATPTGNSA